MIEQQIDIQRDGTSQLLRQILYLDPSGISIDDRDLKYFLDYVAQLAEIITFYNLQDQEEGNFSVFFPLQSEISNFIDNISLKKDHSGHLALFLAFLNLLEFVKSNLNKLSKSHLDYYYKKVLRFKQRPPVADKVNVFFEVNPSVVRPIELNKGIEFLGGKDQQGNLILFTLDKNFVVSKAQIAQISTIFTDLNFQNRIYDAPAANSSDGLGAPLPEDAPYWATFGESQTILPAGKKTMRPSDIGLAIASPILLLHEGKRSVDVTLTCRKFGLSSSHINDLKTNGVSDTIAEQLISIVDVGYNSVDEFRDAIIALVGATNFSTFENNILSYIDQPFLFIEHQDLLHAFSVEATGAAGWFRIPGTSVSKQLEQALKFTIQLNPEDPAIVDFNPEVHHVSIEITHPAIQLLLNHENSVFLYSQLAGVKVIGCKIEVEASGITDLILQSDSGILNITQPFLPFGSLPLEGSTFYFGNHEIFSKKLDSLDIQWSWAGLPTSSMGFQDYYSTYGFSPAIVNESFSADFFILDRSWKQGNNSIALFKSQTASGTQPLVRDIYTVSLPGPFFDRQVDAPEFENYSSGLPRGFGKLVLKSPDFGHSIFPILYGEKAIIKATTNPAQALPNPPYTPKLNHFSLSYKSSVEFVPNGSQADTFFQVEPFGFDTFHVPSSVDLLPKLPRASMYIGLSNITPPQNCSIFFQMLEGSANPDVEVNRSDVQWYYLSDTGWVSLNTLSILMDTTYGLQTSGIIEFSIGRDATSSSPRMPGKLHWLRGAFSNNPSGISKLRNIFPNATVTTLKQTGSEVTSLSEPLPPGRISSSFTSIEGIKGITQPFPSYQGKALETDAHFYQRVSERLRHRNRAVNTWDYEHLILEAFPGIFKVKCLPHTNKTLAPAPGSVTLVVVPDLRKNNVFNPLRPKVSAVIRNQIRDYIIGLNSSFAEVNVENPHYEALLIEMSVGLRTGFDGGIYGQILNEELKRFLTPWAYEEGKEIVFGGRIFKSSILTFVEQREYVDYVTGFKLLQLDRGPGVGEMRIIENDLELNDSVDFIVRPDTVGEEMESEAIASSPRSILVSADNHRITILNPGEGTCPGDNNNTGIGAMIIEVDFFVSNL